MTWDKTQVSRTIDEHSIHKTNEPVKLATIVEGNQKAPFSIATSRCRGGRHSFPWTAPLDLWYVPYNAVC